MSKNIAASVMGRLKNISKELNIPFNLAMQLYAQERFLYRLSKSEYKDIFLSPIYNSILNEIEINSTWDPEKLRWFEK